MLIESLNKEEERLIQAYRRISKAQKRQLSIEIDRIIEEKEDKALLKAMREGEKYAENVSMATFLNELKS